MPSPGLCAIWKLQYNQKGEACSWRSRGWWIHKEKNNFRAKLSGDTPSLGFKHMWRKAKCLGTSSNSVTGSASLARKHGLDSGSFRLNGRKRADQAHGFLLGTKSLSQALNHMSARCCWPESPSKKQLSAIIATYKWISSMIKMFGVGGEQDAQPGGCNLDGGRSGASLKEGRRKKKTCRAVYSGTCTSGQVPPPRLSACSTPPAKASVP